NLPPLGSGVLVRGAFEDVEAVVVEEGLDGALEPFNVVARFDHRADDGGDVFLGALRTRLEPANAGLEISECRSHVPPAGFEPAPPPPEGGALSPELRGLSDAAKGSRFGGRLAARIRR